MAGFRNWTLRSKLVIPALVVMVTLSVALGGLIYQLQKQSAIGQARQTAQAIGAQIAAERATYTDKVVTKLLSENADVTFADMKHVGDPKALPLPASFVHLTSNLVNARGFDTVDLLSLWNINPDKKPGTDDVRKALEDVARNPDQAEEILLEGKDPRLVSVTADIASAQGCVDCHNRHPDSKRHDFRVGDVMGGLVVSIPLAKPLAEATNTALMLTAGLAGVFGIILAVISVIQWMFISKPVKKAVEVANQIARGEIPDKLEYTKSNDEIGVLLAGIQNMLQFLDLKNTMRTLQESASMLTEAQNDMERHSTEAEQQITRQAAALHETQATAQEIKQTSQLASQKAEAVLKVAEQADTVGRTGESAIELSLGGLTDIRAQFHEVARCIRELNERTSQIGGITQTVKDLADQSNMLALNAAIEAVRSGEHGKGFAVVAREIRSLADQSIQATNRVHDILDGTNQAIRTAVSITETGGQRMEGGLLQVKESGESLHELSKIVKDSSQGVRQIAAAVSQQNAGINQIFAAVTDQNKMMDETVQRVNATREAAKLVKGACQQVTAVSMRFHL
jgi:methyl-accepting chemotaxis protein